MQGDFTRDTFDKNKHLLRVLMQQGRVQLDADWNEQVSILLQYLQTLTADLIGSHGGPINSWGFAIEAIKDNSKITDLNIGIGRYYVDGILCENETKQEERQENFVTYYTQPDYPLNKDKDLLPQAPFVVYLDVWERHITYIEDASIREVALGGPDTATRAKVVWQVKTQKLDSATSCADIKPSWNHLTEQWQPKNRGLLKAKAKVGETTNSSDPCIIDPKASYRGAENQLYRVEIHKESNDGKASFKWSRENGSVVFPIRQLSGSIVTLEHLGRDSRFSLREGDWVEIVDDDYVLQNRAEPLLQVQKINSTDLEVTLNQASKITQDTAKHPLLRRWDYRQGDPNKNYPELSEADHAAVIEEGKWLTLEDGIQIWFESGATYRTGDYWLIPARTATGDVEWPGSSSEPLALPPHGVEHHYAKLAVISVDNSGQVTIVDDCRREIGNPFNRVVNASWHHDQVFEASPTSTAVFKSDDLAGFLKEPGLVVQFQKPVRVDSLHKRSVFVLAQQTSNDGNGGLEIVKVLPMLVKPVQVTNVDTKPVRWLIGNDSVDDVFSFITKVGDLTTNGDYTKAVQLSFPGDLPLEQLNNNNFSQLTVVLRGDWILNEEVLFDISWEKFRSNFENPSVSDDLRTQFEKNGLSLSPTATIYKEKEGKEKEGRWRLMDRNKMYAVRREKEQLIICDIHALDGNNIWPSVPGRPSGNGCEGGDWISVIHINQPSSAIATDRKLRTTSNALSTLLQPSSADLS